MAKKSKAKDSHSKKKIIGIVLVAIIFIGAGLGAYFLFMSNDSNSETNDQRSDKQKNQEDSLQSSINDLLARSENVTCTFTYADDSGTASSGTVYIASNQRMRGDFVSQAAGAERAEAGLIQKDETIYTWDKQTKNGIQTKKSTIDNQTDDGQQTQKNEDESVNPDQQYDFNCQEWNVDESKFETPNDVTFTNFDQELQQAQDLSNQAGDIQRQACQQLASESERKACEQAL